MEGNARIARSGDNGVELDGAAKSDSAMTARTTLTAEGTKKHRGNAAEENHGQ
jgi:hypothetical protein